MYFPDNAPPEFNRHKNEPIEKINIKTLFDKIENSVSMRTGTGFSRAV
jgi:hypothetical protein